MKPTNSILGSYGTTIFEVMSGLAREHHAINLGQGFPEDGFDQDILAHAASSLTEISQQYPPMLGLASLRQAVAEHDRRFYGLDLDWSRQVMVTSGATEALTASLLALIEPGDEVVLIEPLYDTYLPIVRLAGGIAKLVRLEPPDWSLPLDRLAEAFSARTKLILFNSPMNPTGKVFSGAELTAIAELVQAHDCYAICDEVYEHLVFDDRRHIPLISLPGMAERTIRIGSAGKTFSLTGWKIGYITASPELIGKLGRAHQFLTFTTPPNLQQAVAYGLSKPVEYFHDISTAMQRKRDRFQIAMQELGFTVLSSAGTYFTTVDIRAVSDDKDDMAFCQRITREVGVAAIPLSAFYAEPIASTLVRFCFAKPDSLIDQAIDRLAGASS
jgi:aspartate/methionine/tyrosine aminotransferase